MHSLKVRTWLAALAVSATTVAGIAALVALPAAQVQSAHPGVRLIDRPTTVSVPDLVRLRTAAASPSAGSGHLAQQLEITGERDGSDGAASSDAAAPDAASKPAVAPLGGSAFPPSPVYQGGGNAQGFPGIDLVSMEKSGTGQYAGTNGGLEPPDQALCVGNGFVLEGVNLAFQVYSSRGVHLTPVIPMAEFFKALPSAIAGPTSFLSDPRCIYDAATKRFFVSSLEVDEASFGVFTRAHNYFAVSKTSDPTKDWYLYSFDVTDDGLNGTPSHPTCPCLGDQPLIGADANGFYISDNEYSDAEVVPVPPPPIINNALNKDVFTLPDFRNGQAQVYALSKSKLINGQQGPVVQFDTASVPVPPNSGNGAVWSSLQPAHSPPGDRTVAPEGGAEYFLSQLDFQTTGDHRIAVWAATNTASLDSAHPAVSWQQVVIPTYQSLEYTYPTSADQKAGPTPIGDTCLPTPCAEEKLNANDDRMNEVMLTNGSLWSGVNTKLPAAGPTGRLADTRTGIQWFQVVPSLAGGKLSATAVNGGYVKVPLANVIFPSIGATPAGHVVMGFTLSGVDYYPSAAWTELDGLAAGQAPTIHVSGAGVAPEDGFTGYCGGGLSPNPIADPVGLCTDGISRWGDYSFTEVDEQGCVWTGEEYISGRARDAVAGDWATYITRVAPQGCSEPALTPK